MSSEIAPINNDAFKFFKSQAFELEKEMRAKLKQKENELADNVAMNEDEKKAALDQYNLALKAEVREVSLKQYDTLVEGLTTVNNLINECFQPLIQSRFDKTKSAVQKQEQIDIEKFHCIGMNILVKFDTVSDKATDEFFNKLTQHGFTLQHVNYILAELPKYGVDGIDHNMLDIVRTQVGNMDFSKTEGVIVKMGRQAIEYFGDDVSIGDTVYVSNEAGLCYKDKDNTLYRLMDARNINAVSKTN